MKGRNRIGDFRFRACAVNALAARDMKPNYRFSMTEESFEFISSGANLRGLLFACDHASRALPAPYGLLGMDPDLLSTHIASDIGAAEVTRTLAAHFAAPAVLARWSRLLIDLNRGEDDPTLVMKLSDGSIVPGNRSADATEVASRIARFHAPYHARIASEISRLAVSGTIPVLISMHSFTPAWKGRARPWEVGVLWDRDARLAKPLMAQLADAGFVVGDNEPYSGELENDCMYRHGTMNGLPHVLIEIRQDLISDDASARTFAARLAPVIESALTDMGPAQIVYTRPLADRGETAMDERTREQLEAAAFRRLVAHLRSRTDVQNIDLMNLAGFCRNCLADWYREAAAEKGIKLEKDQAREIVYGMPPAEWKKKYQKDSTPEQQSKFAASQKTHS
jgi:predicted N-formylglutamate amidohydrolase